MEKKEIEIVLFARGAIEEADLAEINEIQRALGNLGLNPVETYSAEGVKEITFKKTDPNHASEKFLERPIPLSEINSRQHFLVREHFEEFGKKFFGTDKISLYFNNCVEHERMKRIYGIDAGRTNMRAPFGTYGPKYTALKVVDRSEIGIRSYEGKGFTRGNSVRTDQAARFAIEVGTFLDEAARQWKRRNLSMTEGFMVAMAEYLKDRIIAD